MADKPTTLPRLGASDGTITSPGHITEPPEVRKDKGMLISAKAIAQYFNWYLNWIYRWFYWLNGLFDAWGRPTYDPQLQFRENWVVPFTKGVTGALWSGSPWYLHSTQVGTGVVSNIDGLQEYRGVVIQPGNANADDLFIGLKVNASTSSGPGVIRTSSTAGERAKIEWEMNLSAEDNTAWYAGLIPRDTLFSTTVDYIAFRRLNGQTTWRAVTHLADNTETVTDTGVSDTTIHKFRLEYVAGSTRTVNFWVDGVLKASHTTKIVADYNFGVGAGATRGAGSLTSLMGVYPLLVDYQRSPLP